MAIPYKDYVTPGSNVKVQDYLRHSSIKVSGSWAPIEDVQVKDGGAWRDVKEVHVKSGGSWRLVHEGEHFHFIQAFSAFLDGEWNIPNWVANTAGYSGNKIKGVVILGNKNDQNAGNYSRQLNLGNFSSDSIIYLRLQLNSTIIPAGGNGGNVGNNGQNGQRGLYSRTNFILDNAGMICGGGGGGAGGNDSNYTYPVEQAFGCMKGSTCYQTDNVTEFVPGGGGGGGAGYPTSNTGRGGNGGSQSYNGANGQLYGGGGGGGAAQNGTSNAGGDGGNLGQNGQDTPGGGSPGNSGTAIDGWSYRVSQAGNGDGTINGPKVN